MDNVVLGRRRHIIEHLTFKVCTLLTNYLADYVYHTIAGLRQGKWRVVPQISLCFWSLCKEATLEKVGTLNVLLVM
jgi:hypothetical protein